MLPGRIPALRRRNIVDIGRTQAFDAKTSISPLYHQYLFKSLLSLNISNNRYRFYRHFTIFY